MRKLSLGFCLILVVQLVSCDEFWVEAEYHSYSETEYIYEEYEYEVDLDDPSGGLEYWSDLYKGTHRSFHGSYELDEFNTTCNDHGYSDPDLELPAYLDVYAYEDMIDFETDSSDLVWNAAVYPNDTFDFETNYLDWYGHASVILPCSCTIYQYGEWQEVIECACTPSNTVNSCYFSYELM